jgi:hypothetical protein
MVLTDGTDTREEVKRPGPYCDEIAVVLDRIGLDGFSDETQGGEFGGALGVRMGRRVLWIDSQGFMSSERFATADEASDTLCRAFPYTDDEEG